MGFPANIGFTGGIKGLTCYEEAGEKLSFNGEDCDSLFVNLNDSEINNHVSLVYANELIQVQFSTNAEYVIQVTDIHGSIVLSDSAHGVFYINRKQFSLGIYIISIIDDYNNNVFTKKLFFNY